MESEGDEIKSRQPSKREMTLLIQINSALEAWLIQFNCALLSRSKVKNMPKI